MYVVDSRRVTDQKTRDRVVGQTHIGVRQTYRHTDRQVSSEEEIRSGLGMKRSGVGLGLAVHRKLRV